MASSDDIWIKKKVASRLRFVNKPQIDSFPNNPQRQDNY